MSAEGLPLRSAPARGPLPAPAPAPDVVLGAGAERARRALAGFAPAHLLSEVSVARAVGMVAEEVRTPGAWLRMLLSGLEAFRLAQPERRLAVALAAAWSMPGRADQTLADFAAHLGDVPPPQLARLGLGPKLWYTANGVPVAWRPLPGGGSVPPRPPTTVHMDEFQRLRAAARGLRQAGLAPAEVVRLRIGDLGRLAPGGVFVPELLAEPLIMRVRPGRSTVRQGDDPWLVLVDDETRVAVIAAVLSRYGVDAACRNGRDRIFGDVEPGGVE